MEELDVIHNFIVSELNMMEPNTMLEEIKFAIDNNLSAEEFEMTFNDYSITIQDGKIFLKAYYFGAKKLVDYSDFEERLLAFYKKHPYNAGETS
jgi:adenosine deaminase